MSLLALAVFVAAFLAQVLAEEAVSVSKTRKDGGLSRYMLLINKEEQLATEHVWAGRDSATVLFDYKSGIIAYRVFDGQACYAAKMNRNTFPALDKLRETLDNEKNHKQSPPPPGKKYNVNLVPMKDQGKLGAPVQALCQGLPAYWAQEQIGEMFFIDAGACLRVDLLILDVSLCGHVGMSPDIAPLPLI
ncbi:gastrokine-2-like [Acipenser oxyrinchus oxyrinchus]|uniref:Gastrokine-2-like n=1 Tax=Acipenser oxyrinchus oxyrinchus TaxID=40147 RepID=A0AAD8FSR4_ACIOX|nr:gastrokine-2-like [Acipenser oxyrinchus oxyrinchus]